MRLTFSIPSELKKGTCLRVFEVRCLSRGVMISENSGKTSRREANFSRVMERVMVGSKLSL